MTDISRRLVLGGLLAVVSSAALARTRLHYLDPHPHGVRVDVSPLRAQGDFADADYYAARMPDYLRQSFGPGRDIAVRIDSVSYGAPGSDGNLHNTSALDVIEGVGFVGGRQVPLTVSLHASISLPDVDGSQGRVRQELLARSFAQWLPRQLGL